MSKETKITVGFELEVYRLAPTARHIIDQAGFGTRIDSSIKGPNGQALPRTGSMAGTEVVTPIYEVEVEVSPADGSYKADLSAAQVGLQYLCNTAAQVNSTCGFHIHLGRPSGEPTTWNPRRLHGISGGQKSEWKPSQIRTWAAIGLLLENKVFELVPETRKSIRHCRRLAQAYAAEDLLSYYVVNHLKPCKQDNNQRYCWLNLIETRRPASPTEERIGYARSEAFGTVEIRALGETSSYSYTLAWLNLWTKVAAAIAYLPPESAVIRCASSSWLQPEIDALHAEKDRHEQFSAPINRSVIPPENQAMGVDTHNNEEQ